MAACLERLDKPLSGTDSEQKLVCLLVQEEDIMPWQFVPDSFCRARCPNHRHTSYWALVSEWSGMPESGLK